MKLGLVFIVLIGIIMIEQSYGRPEELEEDLLRRVKRTCGCICACSTDGLADHKKKRSTEGLEVDHEMTKRHAPELALLAHYRNKRSPSARAPANCCCICDNGDHFHF